MQVYFTYNRYQNYRKEYNKIRDEYNHKINKVCYVSLCNNKCNTFYNMKFKLIDKL